MLQLAAGSRRLTVLVLALMISAETLISSARAQGFAMGDIFVSDGSTGLIHWYDSIGTLKGTLDTQVQSLTVGIGFDDAGNLYATNYWTQSVTKFDSQGNYEGIFAATDYTPAEIVFDAFGYAYVSHDYAPGDILKFDSTGTLVARFDVASGSSSGGLELAPDQCTMYYGEACGTAIKRFDTCTGTQLADFSSNILSCAGGVAVVAGGRVLVADYFDVKLLDSAGATVMTYDLPGEDGWSDLFVDPDGVSFWSTGVWTGIIYRFDIATGTILTSFSSAGTQPWAIAAYPGAKSLGWFGAANNFHLTASDAPSGSELADLDGDGDQDLVVACSGSDRVAVLLNQGTGSFGSPSYIVLPAGTQPLDVQIGQFNPAFDSIPDLAVACLGTFEILEFLGTGAANFTLLASIPTAPWGPQSVTTGKLNTDNIDDLMVALAPGGVLVLLGNGAGGYLYYPPGSTPQPFATAGDARSCALGDLNCDAVQDVVTADHNQQKVSVLFGNGAGSLSLPTTYSVSSYTSFAALGDIDGDQDLDIVATLPGSSPSQNLVELQLNNGCGTFATSPCSPITVGMSPGCVALADFDLDGDLDFATSNYFSDDCSVMENTSGCFAPAPGSPYATQSMPIWIGAADLDGDGDPDLAVVNQGSDSVSIFLNGNCRDVSTYCTAQVNSLGCLPAIGWTGWPSSSASTFHVTAANVVGQEYGILFIGPPSNGQGTSGHHAAILATLHGAQLCFRPRGREFLASSGGTAGQCDGTFDVALTSSWLAAHGFNAGDELDAQFVYHDPGQPAGSAVGHTNALRATICP